MGRQKFSINKMKIIDEDFEYIKNNIIEKYKETFPEYLIEIEYKMSKNNYAFIIYENKKIINEEGNIESIKSYLFKYKNSVAIELFAKDKKEEFYQKYYYDQKLDINELKEYIDSTITLYKLQNADLEWDIEKDNEFFTIYGPKPEFKNIFSHRPMKLFYLRFSDCVTKKEFESFKKEVIKSIDMML